MNLNSIAVVLLAASLGCGTARAQIAITETFPSASTNNTLTPAGQGPDFWELTNFGTNPVDLTGYRFNDADATLGGDADLTTLSGITIAPGESIILVQNGTPIATRDDFLAWWGATNLPESLQVLFYTGNGQSSTGDSIVLWDATATSDAQFLDRADFGEAVRGNSFTYDTNGVHGLISTNGVRGAFIAATSDDVGSPGKTAGPVALGFVQQPTPATYSVPAGQDATFTVTAKGLPRPHYQWRLAGVPIEGAINPTLVVTNAQSPNAGGYTCVITNGLTSLTSAVATLTVTTGPAAPSFVTTPKNADAFVGQYVQFSASANGSPTPSFQWLSNGVPLAGQNGATLALPNVQVSDAANYAVTIANASGSLTTNAVLKVGSKPLLRITEVQSTGSTGNQDWWELTNFDTNSFNLKGWRWDDNSHSLAPNNAVAFTSDVVIHPGESIVFVENYAAAQFRAWWTNLPAGLQIVTYAGNGLGLSSTADEVNLWNAVTIPGNELPERIAGVTFAFCPLATTFVYDPEQPPVAGVLATYSTNTISGSIANGMFTATNGAVGSPGRVVGAVVLTNRLVGADSVVSWNTVNTRTYQLLGTESLTNANWQVITNLAVIADSASVTEPATNGTRFYRAATVIPVVSQP